MTDDLPEILIPQHLADRLTIAAGLAVAGPAYHSLPLSVRADLWREGSVLNARYSAMAADLRRRLIAGEEPEEAVAAIVSEITPTPTSRATPDTTPADLFIENPKTGQVRPDPAAFVAWFRRSEYFVVPVERGTFASPGAFDLLRFSDGYYNGTARSFVRGRVEDAFRSEHMTAKDAFREEVVKGIANTSEFHRRRDTFNPPDMVCLRNGILDTRTLMLLPHTPDVVFTWRMPVDYDPSATCPAFDAFLERVMPDPAKRTLLVDLMGYCLWRSNPFQVMFLNVGDGNNGKTTFTRTLEALLGREAVAAESLQSLASRRFAPAELDGKLVNLCDDLPYNQPLVATGVLKILTGEGEMSVERKGQHPFKMHFEGKAISNANRTPEVKDDTFAFWRRIMLFAWDVTVPDTEVDPTLKDRLLAELPGILNRALEGLARVRTRSRFDPDGVLHGAQEEWRRRADPVLGELLDEFEAREGGFVSNRDLFEWHVQRSQQEGREPLTERAFGQRVTAAFPLSLPKRTAGPGPRIWGRPGIWRKGVRPVLDVDLIMRPPAPLIDPADPPKVGIEPAGPFSRQEEGVSRPVPAGSPHTDQETGIDEVMASTGAPAGTGREGLTGGVDVAPAGAPAKTGSATSEKWGRTLHRDCPFCAKVEHHLCAQCDACVWAENSPNL